MKQIVFFDGDCLVCQRSVQLILKYDRSKQFYFASLQSELAKRLLSEHARHSNSVVLLKNEQEYLYSNAVIEISNQLSGIARTAVMLKILPLQFRDKLYQIFAKYRHHIFPKVTTCLLLDEHEKKRFLD